MEGEGFYIFLLLVLLIGGPIGLVFLIRWACKSDSQKTSVKTQSTVKNSVSTPILTKEDRVNLRMKDAYNLALAKGTKTLSFFEKNQKYLWRMIYIHWGKENIIDAEIFYFVYGVHDQLRQKLINEYKGDWFTDVEFLEKVHMPVIGIIEETPPKYIRPNEYADMICELFFALDDDKKFLDVFDKYNYEYPDRIKKMLSNDIDVLSETTFYSVAMTVQMSNTKYLSKGLISADFVLYYYAIYRSVIFSCEIDEEQKSHFERTLKKHFIEYCETMKMFKSKDEAETFFYTRYARYSELITIEDDESTLYAMDELLSFANQRISLHEGEEGAFIRETAEMMARLNAESKSYFSRMLEEYERLSIVSSLDNAIDMVEKQIKSQQEQD